MEVSWLGEVVLLNAEAMLAISSDTGTDDVRGEVAATRICWRQVG